MDAEIFCNDHSDDTKKLCTGVESRGKNGNAENFFNDHSDDVKKL